MWAHLVGFPDFSPRCKQRLRASFILGLLTKRVNQKDWYVSRDYTWHLSLPNTSQQFVFASETGAAPRGDSAHLLETLTALVGACRSPTCQPGNGHCCRASRHLSSAGSILLSSGRVSAKGLYLQRAVETGKPWLNWSSKDYLQQGCLCYPVSETFPILTLSHVPPNLHPLCISHWTTRKEPLSFTRKMILKGTKYISQSCNVSLILSGVMQTLYQKKLRRGRIWIY